MSTNENKRYFPHWTATCTEPLAIDGREALIEIKAEPALKHIPIVILTTSKEQKDIAFSMQARATKFITEPVTFDGWIEVMKSMAES